MATKTNRQSVISGGPRHNSVDSLSLSLCPGRCGNGSAVAESSALTQPRPTGGGKGRGGGQQALPLSAPNHRLVSTSQGAMVDSHLYTRRVMEAAGHTTCS
jgi:hypothetical protein